MRHLLLIISLFLSLSIYAYDEGDSLAVSRPVRSGEQFSWKQTILPATLFCAGATGVTWTWYEERINRPLRNWAGSLRGDLYIHADDYLQYVPAAAYLLLGTAIPSDRSFTERVLVTGTSWAFLAIVVNALKYGVHDLRPDDSRYNSFPSGHTATAFFGAELVRTEYGNIWGAGAYAIAAGTAFLRIYNDRHWLNDVLAGAAIGILSAHVGYWLLPAERRLFLPEGMRVALTPTLPVWGECPGCAMALSWSF